MLAHAESSGWACGCRQPLALLGRAGRFCSTICSTLCAQQKPLPDAPKPNRTIFVAGASLLAGAKTADAITTRQLLDRGGWELDPNFGSHPSPAKQAGINAGIFAAQSLAFYLTERNRHSRTSADWQSALLAHAVVEHLHLAACNAGIDSIPF